MRALNASNYADAREKGFLVAEIDPLRFASSAVQGRVAPASPEVSVASGLLCRSRSDLAKTFGAVQCGATSLSERRNPDIR
jgi:hypothetical protein